MFIQQSEQICCSWVNFSKVNKSVTFEEMFHSAKWTDLLLLSKFQQSEQICYFWGNVQQSEQTWVNFSKVNKYVTFEEIFSKVNRLEKISAKWTNMLLLLLSKFQQMKHMLPWGNVQQSEQTCYFCKKKLVHLWNLCTLVIIMMGHTHREKVLNHGESDDKI